MNKTAAIQQKDDNAALYESLALRGDLSGLSPEQKATYYSALCDRLGLDPATQPFIPLKLNGKEILYASKACTDQLARLHNVNRQIVDERDIRGAYVVTVESTLPNGRKEQSKGAVSIDGLKGEQLCNALMKAETKAKRRATLSILGLGMLDESELETIPAYRQQQLAAVPQPQLTNHVDGEVVTDDAEERREAYVANVRDLCRDLNSEGDSIQWNRKNLNDYINELFNVNKGMDSMTFETFPVLIEDLDQRYQDIIAAREKPV